MTGEKLGKIILFTIAIFTLTGGFLADWNRSHLFNPDWPPHAKLHDAMTIILAFFLGAASLYFLSRKPEDNPLHLRLACILPAFFFAAQALSFAFPGAGGLEREFPNLVPKVGAFYINELPFSVLMLLLLSLGYWLAGESKVTLG